MNQWILLFSLILGLGGTGCENRESGIITIMGEIKGLPEGWVRLYTCPPSNLLLDSCEIREGKYKLKGKLDDPQLGMLFFDVKPEYQPNFMPMVRLFLQPTIMKVYSEREDMKGSLKVENAPLNEQLIACEQFLKNLPEYKQATVLTDSIQLAFYKADMVKVRSMSVVRDSLYQVLIDRVFEKEPEASHSEVVAYLASQYSSPMSGDRVERIVERFDSSFRNSYYVAQMKQFAENDRLLTAGKVFPDFQVFDTLGKTYTLADFKGKYLFVEFSASWCGWCKKEIPHIRKAYEQTREQGGQVVIYGKRGHAEVVGLVGQTNGEALVIENPEDIRQIDFSRPVILFSQTTKSLEGFQAIAALLKEKGGAQVVVNDTICRKVANRIPQLREFAQKHDVVIFVSGEKSSNGKQLFATCCEVNPRTYLVQRAEDVKPEMLENAQSVGISGATSTPAWVMEEIRHKIELQ